MIPLPALPLPQIQRGIDVYHAKSFCRYFGIALVVQFVLPWWNLDNVGGWFGTLGMGGTIWSAIGGAGLVALSFINNPALKLGHYFYAAAGVGALGILWGGSAAAFMWPFNSLGLIGLVGALTSAFLYMRNGWSQQVWIWSIVGIAGLAGGLLLPLGGYGLPLIGIFTIIGGDFYFIVGRIFTTILCLGFIAIVANWTLQVFLKKDSADIEQVERHALVMFWYPLVSLVIIGITGLYADGFHHAVMFGSYLWLTVWGATNALEMHEAGTLNELMQTEYQGS